MNYICGFAAVMKKERAKKNYINTLILDLVWKNISEPIHLLVLL